MSARNVDKHNRFRCITVGFRVSPEEHEHINKAVAMSGLSKQEYCYRRCLERDIVVQGNPRVYKALKDQLAEVLVELKRIEAGASIDDELLENINLITRTLLELLKVTPRQLIAFLGKHNHIIQRELLAGHNLY